MRGWLLQKPVPKMGQIQKGSRQSPLAAAGVGLDQRVNKEQIFICSMKPQPLHLKGSREPLGTRGCSRSDRTSREDFPGPPETKDYGIFFSGFTIAIGLPRFWRRSFAEEAQSEADGNMISFPLLSQWSVCHSCRLNFNFPRETKSMEVSWTFPLCYLWKRQSLGLYSRNMITSSSTERERLGVSHHMHVHMPMIYICVYVCIYIYKQIQLSRFSMLNKYLGSPGSDSLMKNTFY